MSKLVKTSPVLAFVLLIAFLVLITSFLETILIVAGLVLAGLAIIGVTKVMLKHKSGKHDDRFCSRCGHDTHGRQGCRLCNCR